jgi:sn-glycerol 3-phosphate transport system ATP-binding protein
MVFQNYALYPHMSVFDNMAYGLRIRGMAKDDIRARVQESAGLLGLGALLDRKPRQLSGGQRQRVAMGRAIVREPKLFLFDEPLSNLDATLRVTMRAEIRRLQRRMGVTSLYVTHDQVEAMTLGDRLLVMHQGIPVQLATPMEVFERPANTYVAGFIGAPAMNFLPATLSHGGTAAQLGIGPLIPFADGKRPGADGRTLTVGIRPEHVTLAPQGLPMQIDLIEPLGSETVIIGRLEAGDMISVKLAGPAPASETISLAIGAEHLHVFDAETGLRLDPVN